MNNLVETIQILRITSNFSNMTEDIVVRESPLTIVLNGHELVTLQCSPSNLNYLAAGFLLSEGLINSKNEIKHISIDDARGVARVETVRGEFDTGEAIRRYLSANGTQRLSSRISGGTGDPGQIDSSFRINVREILSLHHEFQRRSEVFQATGGVHSAALCDPENILVFAEDIGRHNVIDKVFGRCLLEDISYRDRIVAVSCRVSSEILFKVARRKIPILASKSAPTNLGIKLAKDLGITLIGFIRDNRMNVYSGEWRLNNA